jgi:murein DD-endopeptidase MepM/ murein hydrolase activator NlpD
VSDAPPPQGTPPRPTPRASPSPGQRSRRFEIQIHPADIRKGVRYLFFSRRHLAWGWTALAAYLAFLALAAAMAPPVVSAVVNRGERRALRAERQRQGERAQAMVDRLGVLEGRSEALRLKVDKIFLAYGLTGVETAGQGGYPAAPPPPVPKSIFGNVVERGQTLQAGISEQLQVVETFLGEIQAFEAAHREQARTTPSIIPLRGEDFVLTSPFGNRRSPFTKALDFHTGIDLAAPVGAPIYAPAEGVVVFAGRYPLKMSVAWWRYGGLVVLRHGEHFVTLFGHCEEIRVQRGQKVVQGDLLGTVGNTGLSTNPHLHYEVRRRDDAGKFQPVDPRIYILDHRWRDEERILVQARSAPALDDYQPLPPVLGR